MPDQTLLSYWPNENEDGLMARMNREHEAAATYQERRHDAWDESYRLCRNRPVTNRLTQRQAVYIPLMKETVKTLLSKIDDPPVVEWKELSGDIEKEVIVQEAWNEDFDANNLEIKDIQDKKTVLLHGRSFKMLNWRDGRINMDVMDIYDVVVDPMVNPIDIESARFIVRRNIFKSLREILADDSYDKEGKEALKEWKYSQQGIIMSGQIKEEWEKKVKRLKDMGVDSSDFENFAAGDTVCNLSEHFTTSWDNEKSEFYREVVTYADGRFVLKRKKLKQAIGVDFWPFITWGEDTETDDFWSDGPADLVRTPNKLVNIWFSQLVENRTLKNFQMFWYDATNEKYVPQTYEPGPGRMLPAPGNPRETIMPVELQGMDEALNAIDYVTKIVERGTAATAIEKGTSERKQITLGEVQMLVGKSMERTQSMAKFYRRAWKELAVKWYAMTVANYRGERTLYKTGIDGRMWPKTITPADMKSEAGFRAFVLSSSEQDDEKTSAIQRMQFLISQFPTNMSLKRIAQKRMLDLVDFTAEEVREIANEEKQAKETSSIPQPTMGQPTQPALPTAMPQV